MLQWVSLIWRSYHVWHDEFVLFPICQTDPKCFEVFRFKSSIGSWFYCMSMRQKLIMTMKCVWVYSIICLFLYFLEHFVGFQITPKKVQTWTKESELANECKIVVGISTSKRSNPGKKERLWYVMEN
jgi:hypothetical protein